MILFVLTNALTVYELLESQREAARLESEFRTSRTQVPVIEFNRLFAEKVLGAQGEVDFATRLEMENQVHELEDAEILIQWNKFVSAQTESEAQTEVKELLSLLAHKMRE